MNSLHYALAVGINKYPGLTPLRGPIRDALEFVDWLASDAGGQVPKSNIRHIQVDESRFNSPDGAMPTRNEVNNALFDLLEMVGEKTRAEPTDWLQTRLYFYLSGHGVSPTAKEAALLMANVRRGMLGESIPSALYMEDLANRQVFHELVFFADCCRTATIQAQISAPPFDRTNSRNSRGPVHTVLGFATGFGNLAYEPTAEEEADPDAARGYFTQALLEGLRGSAVDSETGQIDSNSLAKFVRSRVLDLTRSKPTPQEPPMFTDPSAPVVFRAGVPRPKYRVTMVFPAGFQAAAVLSDGRKVGADGSFHVLDRHDASSGPWTISLPDGLYEVRPADAKNGAGWNHDGLFRILGADCDVQLG